MNTPVTPAYTPWPGVIQAYKHLIPGAENLDIVTLKEGNTPLLWAPHLSERLQSEVYIKVEGHNPTGSFKDRGMTMAVSDAKTKGQKALLCASTGNTSASAAAYAAAGDLTAAVLIPAGKIAMGKLAQAVMYGAKIVQIDGNFDDCLELVRKTCAEHPEIALVNSVNPARIEGQKTAAFEIVDQLKDAPDIHALPVGNAGNITAYWRGYQQYHGLGNTSRLPQMLGVQAAGAAPLVTGAPVTNPQTVATAIQIGSPASWHQALAAREQSQGWFRSASDEKILDAYRWVAAHEGIFVEPASAASIAGVIAAREEGIIPEGKTIVCTVTGNGLKDPNTALGSVGEVAAVPVDPSAVLAALEL